MYELTKIKSHSAARVGSALALLAYLFASLLSYAGDASSFSSGNSLLTLAVGIIISTLAGAIFGWLCAGLYNLIASRWRGLQLEFTLLADDSFDDEQTHMDSNPAHQTPVVQKKQPTTQQSEVQKPVEPPKAVQPVVTKSGAVIRTFKEEPTKTTATQSVAVLERPGQDDAAIEKKVIQAAEREHIDQIRNSSQPLGENPVKTPMTQELHIDT